MMILILVKSNPENIHKTCKQLLRCFCLKWNIQPKTSMHGLFAYYNLKASINLQSIVCLMKFKLII